MDVFAACEIDEDLSNKIYVLSVGWDRKWIIHVKVGNGEPDYANPIESMGRLKVEVRAKAKLKLEKILEDLERQLINDSVIKRSRR